MKTITAYVVTVWSASDPFESVDYDVVAESYAEARAIAEAVFTAEEKQPILKSRAYEAGETFYCKSEAQ